MLLAIQYFVRRMKVEEAVCDLRLTEFALAYGSVWALVVAMLPLGYRPFIYFQF
jgi:alginate O-acetyltransferase complex protein AlgI